jgi:hypothetical protein
LLSRIQVISECILLYIVFVLLSAGPLFFVAFFLAVLVGSGGGRKLINVWANTLGMPFILAIQLL